MTKETDISDLIAKIRQNTDEALNQMYEWDEEDFVDFVDRLEGYVHALEPYRSLMSESAKKSIEEILECDLVIKNRMELLKGEAARTLQNLGDARIQQKGYQNHYTMDSLFIDKKN